MIFVILIFSKISNSKRIVKNCRVRLLSSKIRYLSIICNMTQNFLFIVACTKEPLSLSNMLMTKEKFGFKQISTTSIQSFTKSGKLKSKKLAFYAKTVKRLQTSAR